MSVPMLPWLQASPALAAPKKKRVLLVDSSRAKRDLRSETMRKLGAEVDCAADISEARCWWRADLYDLVLMNVDATKVQTEKFCDDIHRLMPHQQIMFLVGKPGYLAASLDADQATSMHEEDIDGIPGELKASSLANNGSGGAHQRWGILEACRKISAVRSELDARSRALRDRPAPMRDSESHPRNNGNEIKALTELTETIAVKDETAEEIQ